MKNIGRLSLLTAALLMGLGTALAQTSPEVRWRLTSSFPKNTDILWSTAENLARRVGELTDGRFRIQPFSAGEIAPAPMSWAKGTPETVHQGSSRKWMSPQHDGQSVPPAATILRQPRQ